MLRSVRRLHFGRGTPAKAKGKAPAVPREIVQAAQTSRHSINGSVPNAGSVAQPLMDSTEAVTSQSLKDRSLVPESVFSLIGRTLEKVSNYKGSLNADQLQTSFRTVATHNAVQPATRSYMDVYRHSKSSKEERLRNGKEFFRMLRQTGHSKEANAQISALLRDNAQVVTDETSSESLDIVAQTAAPSSTGSAVLAIIQGSQTALPNGPSTAVLIKGIELSAHWASRHHLDVLANHVYFTNPHFHVDDEVAVVFLDAYLEVSNSTLTSDASSVPDTVRPTAAASPLATQLDHSSQDSQAKSQSQPTASETSVSTSTIDGGQRILKSMSARLESSPAKPSLEICESLLMSIINSQEPPSMGKPVHRIVKEQCNKAEYTKETWDVLAQWAVYSDPDLKTVSNFVTEEMPEEYRDTKTLELVSSAASEKAQRGEQQITAITEYFEKELGVVLDASIYEILMRRALRAMEVDRARQLFFDSNTDWNINSNKHIPVSSELLVALCRTTSISPQLILDTYQRVRLFVPRVSYKAQVAMLQMLLHEADDGSLTPAGIFLIEQFGEAPQLSYEDHKEIFNLFYHRILAAQTEDEAWNSFGILNCTIFLPYEAYYPLQLKLSRLDRPDAAHLLFRQLRNRAKSHGTRPPGDEMYMMLFHEYAQARYEEGIHELETYFRLDLNNEMSVPMMNRMLAAYSALEDGHKVSYLWTEARALPRGGSLGPNEETMCIMLQFMSKSLGLDAVDDLWTSIPQDFKMKLTSKMLHQFVIANCYHGYYSRALEIVKMAPQEYNLTVSSDSLRDSYNWSLSPARKEEVREYALEHFPEEWQKLEASGELVNVLLPAEDEIGHSDEASRRFAAINELEKMNNNLVSRT